MPSGYGPPLIDFSKFDPLGNFQEGQKIGRERQLQEGLNGLPKGSDGSIDWGAAAAKALELGNVDAAAKFSQLATSTADKAFDRQYKGGMLDIARQQANRREEPEDIRKLRAAGIDPASAAGHKALYPRTDTPISATDKKAIFTAEDENPELEGTVESLKRAREINRKTFTGLTAGMRGTIGTTVPGAGLLLDPAASEATAEFGQIMSKEAIQSMAATLKGATTNFELQKFERILADPSTPPAIRERTIDRMLQLAEKKREINTRRAAELRSGTYFKPPGAQPPSGAKQITKAEYDALPSGSTYTAPDGSTRTKQ